MLQIRFEIEGVDVFNRAFSRMDASLSDLRPVWDNLQRDFWKIEDEQFKSENARGASGRWKPLSRAYAKQKVKRWGMKTILRASDRMYESLTRETADTILLKDPMEFSIGTSVEHAKFHQRGGGKLPKRPVIDWSESQKRELMKAMQRDILKEMRKAAGPLMD